jgi:hypothetical protein
MPKVGGGGQAKRPRQTGQLSYARATWMAIVCEDYLVTPISKDNFVGGYTEGCVQAPRRGVHPQAGRLLLGQNQYQETCEWLARSVPTLKAWEGSRLKIVGLDALPTFKRVTAWFPCPVKDTEALFRHLCRLNRGLEAGNEGHMSTRRNLMWYSLCSVLTRHRSLHWRR